VATMGIPVRREGLLIPILADVDCDEEEFEV
jgi:hypothetical protein